MLLPCQVWFDTETPEAFERDDLDTIPMTEQLLRTLARSEVQIESPTKRDLSQLQIPQHEKWHSESRRSVRREKRDEANRCCWTADRRWSGSVTERS